MDACFLVDAALGSVLETPEHSRKRQTQEWWDRIYQLALEGKSTIYIPELCIAEAFKVVAKKTWSQKLLDPKQKTKVETLLRKWVTIDNEMLKRSGRTVPVHDISTNRDIIISVDRFLRITLRAGSKIDCEPDRVSISGPFARLLSPHFQTDLIGVKNPYCNGGASNSVVPDLEQSMLDNILKKQFYDCKTLRSAFVKGT